MKLTFSACLIFSALFLFTSLANAGESGYIKNGVTYVVFKDGKKVGNWPSEEQRNVAAVSGTFDLQYQDDGDHRCYSNWVAGKAIALSCVKK